MKQGWGWEGWDGVVVAVLKGPEGGRETGGPCSRPRGQVRRAWGQERAGSA